MPEPPELPADGGHDRDLVEMLDETRAGDRSASRSRERWLARQAEESARFAGTLLDLAERRAVATLRTESGRSYHGAIIGVGADFLVLRAPPCLDVYVSLDAVVSVRPHADEPAAASERLIPSGAQLVDVLVEAAAERLRLSLVCRGGTEPVAGELRAAGVDVLTVRLEGPRGTLCYVRASAVCEVVVERGTHA